LGEECDDANTNDTDLCDNNCMIVVPANCGNGTQEGSEECDAGASNSDTQPDTCRTNCLLPWCGDGVQDWGAGEECDDANTVAGDGCDACIVETPAACGDGNLDIAAGEQCDDGGTINGDGCSSSCQFEQVGASCGNGALEGVEVCDDNNLLNADACNPTCNMTNTVTNLIQDTVGWGGFNGITSDADNIWFGGIGAIYQVPLGTNMATDCPFVASACVATLVAGQEGTNSQYTDADGTAARMGAIESMSTDGNTVWFTDNNHTLRAMTTTAPYTVTTLAGDPGECGTVDGPAGTSRITGARGVSYYNGSVYLVDACEGTMRQYDLASGFMSTVVGGPRLSGAPACGGNCNAPAMGTEGYGNAAEYVSPRYTASDNSGNIYVIDTNGQIMRTYNTVNGYAGTLAGSTFGYTDGTGTQAQFDRPRGISSDGTSVYVSEQNEQTMRQVNIASQEVSTMVGVRGCQNAGVEGQGGTGVAGQCGQTGANGWPNFDTPFQQTFHYPSGSIIVRSAWGIHRVN
jgi:cysteine-rich repeat protein